MQNDYLGDIRTFTLENLPDLDTVVLGALQFFSSTAVPPIDVRVHRRPLVVGSVNALRTGRIMFTDVDAVFVEESGVSGALLRVPEIDAVYVISASGAKHAVEVAELAKGSGKPAYLITSNAEAPAMQYFEPSHIFVIPHIREPYTYNTSTYLGMLLSVSNESTVDILSFIERDVAPRVPEWIGTPTSFILVVPSKFEVHRGMFETKFDELFGSERYGRAFTKEEMMHAKTVVPSQNECYIDIGVDGGNYGNDDNRIHIPIPDSCGPAAFLAIGYYIIGRIQRVHPPFFKQHIAEFTERAGAVFNQTISPIVE